MKFINRNKTLRQLFFFAAATFIGAICASQVKAEKPISSSGWQPPNKAVQWKVQQFRKDGTELRYYFQNHTKRKLLITGYITFTDPKGKTRKEYFKTKINPREKKGGKWRGFVFFLNDSRNWKMSEFKYQSTN